MRVLLAAEESAGIQALRLVAGGPDELVAVLTSAPSGSRGTVVADVARKLGCAVWPAKRVKEAALADEMRAAGVDLLVNVHSLYIISEAVVDAPAIGSFNLHPGALPAYAGLNAPNWSIFNGEPRHCVTLHWMRAGIDTGDVAYEGWFDLAPDDTGLSVSARCVREGIPLLRSLLEAARTDPASIPARPQPAEGRRCYRRSERPFDGRMRWSEPAARLQAFVRASDFHPMPSPWGDPQTTRGDEEIGIAKAALTGRSCGDEPGTVGTVDGAGADVATGDEWLRVTRVRRGGTLSAAAELLRPGDRLVG